MAYLPLDRELASKFNFDFAVEGAKITSLREVTNEMVSHVLENFLIPESEIKVPSITLTVDFNVTDVPLEEVTQDTFNLLALKSKQKIEVQLSLFKKMLVSLNPLL